jgi:hypothetical protein
VKLVQRAGEASWPLPLDQIDYRVRFCALGMDEEDKDQEDEDEDEDEDFDDDDLRPAVSRCRSGICCSSGPPTSAAR